MVARQGIHLAVYLIKSHFGDLVSRVCECLLNRGTLTLHQIARFVELDPDDNNRNNLLVKNCLLVLIQHNCVQAFSVPKNVGSGEVKSMTQYMAMFDNILHRLRFAKFLGFVRDDLGPQCETLLEGLLQHGRLTFDQLVLRATSKQPAEIRDKIRPIFNKLVQAQYIERCPRSDPFISPDDEGTSAAPRKRNSKSATTSLSIEEQAMHAASLPDAERFCGVPTTALDITADKKGTERNPCVSAGEKRKHDELEEDSDVQAAITENEVLWRANFEKFVHCLKKKICVENVRSRFGNAAGIVLKAMIEANCERSSTEKDSVTASVDAIERVIEKSGGISIKMEDIRVTLEQLGCRLCGEEAEALYTLDLKGIIESSQNDEVETIILRKYGKEAYRVFRFLVKSGRPIETDKIADSTLIEKKDNYEILYKLWKDDYLDMQKVVATIGRQMTFFLWKVRKEDLREHIVNDMYHAALNLSQRAAHMLEKDPEILLPKQSLPETLRKEKTAQQKRWMILQSSLAKLDSALMLFHDFQR